MAFAVILPARLPLGPPHGGWVNAAAGFASCCGPLGCSPSFRALDAGLRHRGLPPDAASLLPGSLATTWTGLPPAGGDGLADTHDQVIEPTALRSRRACPLDTQYMPHPRITGLRSRISSSRGTAIRRRVSARTLSLNRSTDRCRGIAYKPLPPCLKRRPLPRPI